MAEKAEIFPLFPLFLRGSKPQKALPPKRESYSKSIQKTILVLCDEFLCLINRDDGLFKIVSTSLL